MNSASVPSTSLVAARFLLTGIVQGVGMRPTVARLAQKYRLNGFVRNDGRGVQIHVEGHPATMELFAAALPRRLPPSSQIDQLRQQPTAVTHADVFEIQKSDSPEAIATSVPPDLAVCPACLAESQDSFNRRYHYPFTTCNDCGPRYSLIQSMPHDRDVTSMSGFELCEDCSQEYSAADDRRFHGQTNSCPTCGPQLHCIEDGIADRRHGEEAVSVAAMVIRGGGIVAMKGVGGYQLVCDATCTAAIEKLRIRKRRLRKPFAVMVASIEAAQKFANICGATQDALRSLQNPIVVVPLSPGGKLSCAVNPGLRDVGVMLPTSTLHALLLNAVRHPCVVTSGNCDGEPLAYRMKEATEKLTGIADVWLHHNRDIVRPIDDSVVRLMGDRQVTIRAARGLTPMPMNLKTTESLLATGGHQKVAIALSNGRQSVVGPHIGDMNSVGSRQRFVDHVQQLCELYQTKPAVIAHDLHPDYFTTRWAADQHVPTIAVQHHHAHTVAGMLEHQWMDREVLGVCFDGTGYGTDGTIWGGEFLICTATSFRRAARSRPFALFGGDKASQQPWRITATLLHEAGVTCHKQHPSQYQSDNGISGVLERCRAWSSLPARHHSSQTRTSSMGRLFDGVAAFLLNITDASFEGEAAMRLEAICDLNADGEYDLPLTGDGLMELDWRPMLQEIAGDVQNQIPVPVIATRFTRSIASAVARVCEQFPQLPVVLCGGCFQNTVLTEMTAAALQSHRLLTGLPGTVPPNDGGLAAGQLAVAAAQLQSRPLAGERV